MSHVDAITAVVDTAKRNNRSAVTAYLASLAPWPSAGPAPQVITPGTTGNPTEEVRNGKTMSCTTTNYTLTANPDKIVIFEPDKTTLWPGALIQGESLLKIGSLRELPIKKRAPLPLSVDLFIKRNSKIVAHPASSTVQSAIGELIAPIEGKEDFGSSVSFAMKETYSSKQAMLSLGLSASHSGIDVTAKHSDVTAHDKRVITASFFQKCFTVSIDNPSVPADLFTSDFSIGDMHEQERLGRISRTKIPVILSSITYGRIMYVTISSKKSLEEVKNALNASYNVGGTSGSAELKAEYKTILEEAELTVSAIGIEEKNFGAIIRTGKIQEFFASPMDVRSVRPISYIFNNLADLSIAGLTDSASYDITVCTPGVVSADVTTRCTGVDTNLKNYYNFVIAAAGNKEDIPTRNLRIGQYKGYHGEVIAHLDWLRVNAATMSADNKSWLRRWGPTVIDEIERQVRSWRNGYANDSWDTRPIYAEALRLSADEETMTTAVLKAIP